MKQTTLQHILSTMCPFDTLWALLRELGTIGLALAVGVFIFLCACCFGS